MKVSIITVSYNAAATIEATIQSVLSQSYSNIEYIIIDGGSTDGTQDIVNRYADQIAHFSSEKDGGIYFGMNKGIGHCTGDYIGLLNADDVYFDETVVEQVISSLTNSGADSLYGDLVYVQENDLSKVVRRWVSGQYNRPNFLKGWMPPHPTFFVRSELYKQYGVFDTSFRFAADYELMLRFLYRYNASTVYLDRTLIKMRVGGVSNSSIQNRIKANKEDRRAWEVNGIKPKWYSLYLKPISKIRQYLKK